MNENTNTAFVPTEAAQKRRQEEGRKSSMLFGLAAGAATLRRAAPARTAGIGAWGFGLRGKAASSACSPSATRRW